MAGGRMKVWDIGLRLFHWVLVILFCLSSYSAFQDKFGTFADMHFYSGYSILILVVWRILWGLFGSETARFAAFVKSPGAAVRHLRSMLGGMPYRETGHSALAGYSVILMLLMLLAQATMGLFASDGMIFSGPLSDSVASSLSSDMTSWHKLLGRILIGFVGLHVFAVLVYLVLKRVNLIWPMISGRKEAFDGQTSPALKPAWLASLLFLVAGAIVCTVVFIV